MIYPKSLLHLALAPLAWAASLIRTGDDALAEFDGTIRLDGPTEWGAS